MNRVLLYILVTVLASVVISGCAHTGVKPSDLLGVTREIPHSPSSVYQPRDTSLSTLEGAEKGEITSDQSRTLTEGDIPSEFKGKVLTLGDCIRIALESNPKTRSTWAAIRSAAARVGEEKSAYLPSADLSAGAVRQKQVTSQSLQAGQPTETDDLFDAAFGLSYLLFDGGQRSARVSRARADLQALGFQHNTTLQDVALQVEQSYYSLLASRWSLQVAEETVRNAEYHVRLSQARFESGLVPRSDVLKAETERADAKLSLVSARNTRRIAEGTLVSTMGVKVFIPIEIADIPESRYPHEMGNMGRLLEEAAKNRTELLAAVAKVKSVESAIQEVRSQYWPKVTANAGYGWLDDTFFPNRDQWSVGLGISVPLFTGFKRGYQVERARRDLDQARSDYASRLRGVELEVWTTYWKLMEAGEAIQAAQTFVTSAEESARLAEGEYKVGTGNIIALIDAQTALSSARNRLVQARFDWYTARAGFERSIGRSLIAGAGSRDADFGQEGTGYSQDKSRN
jgi:TolC family type I secretion outer membrane protein